MTLGGWAFEKGKRGPNESKFTLFTIGTVVCVYSNSDSSNDPAIVTV